MMEQRQKQRFGLHLPYEIKRGSGVPPIQGYIANASSKAVLFVSSSRINVGEKIEYSLTLPTGSSSGVKVRLECAGLVIRTDPAKSEFVASIERYEFVREIAAATAAA